jgi:muramoyltetrapeptide carboxypeptidase
MLRVYPIAPSGTFLASKYEAGVQILKSLGCRAEGVMPLRQNSVTYLNGDDVERLSELEKALASDEHELVWAVRGGYGLTRLLPLLQLPMKKKRPVVVGFSDTSALMLHLWKHAQMKSIHAAGISRLADEPQETLHALASILRGRADEVCYPVFYGHGGQKRAAIEGILLAANLCMLTHLVGTESMPNLAGTILLLEEVGEAPYRMDRMLTQLLASGSLKDVQAVIVGHLTMPGSPKEVAREEALHVFIRCLVPLGLPVFGQIPVGHESPNWPIPFGVKARILNEGKISRLEILENIL